MCRSLVSKFYCQVLSIFSRKGLTLCSELNILDDLKIVDYRKFSLMQQTACLVSFNDHYTVIQDYL